MACISPGIPGRRTPRVKAPWRLAMRALAMALALASGAAAQENASPGALDLDAPEALATVIGQLNTKRVVFVGETHDRYDHHLNQLEIIRRLHQLDPKLAIGVEYFEQRFQSKVDDYIAGQISENEFLRATEYFKEWGYDYRLYAPIFRFAREQRIPVRALNIPTTLASTVAKEGIAGLTAEQRVQLPKDIAPADEAYRARLREAFASHETKKPGAFERFVDAQLAWDESMAASAAEYLNANPERRMVILAGAGHVAFGSGIPSRLERRTHSTYAIVLSSGQEIEPHIANFILLDPRQKLPPAGVLGAGLKDEQGECRIGSLVAGGAAQQAGLKNGDVLVEVAGQAIKTAADVRLALWDKNPGDRIKVRARRGRDIRDLDIELKR